MGNKQPTTFENSCIEELNNIDENNLDINNIDKLQIKDEGADIETWKGKANKNDICYAEGRFV